MVKEWWQDDLYGQIAVDLIIANRQDAEEFYKKMLSSQVKPLKELTQNIHYHTILARDEKTIEQIEQSLLEKKYLILDPQP